MSAGRAETLLRRHRACPDSIRHAALAHGVRQGVQLLMRLVQVSVTFAAVSVALTSNESQFDCWVTV
jgi:hypothetical protein